MNYSEFLINKGFTHTGGNDYAVDVVEDRCRDLLLVRCEINNEKYSAHIIVQLGEPESHIMARCDISLDRLKQIDFIVAGMVEQALYKYKELLVQEYLKVIKQ